MPERLHIPYLPDGDPRHAFDLFTPEGPGPWPLLCMIHGGGWMNHGREVVHPVCRHAAARGWAVATLGYRLAPQTRHPGQRQDIAAALAAIVRDAPALGIDPSRTVLQGSSAGGWLALDAAIAPPPGMRLLGIVAYCPVVVLEPRHGFVQAFLGERVDELRVAEDLAARIPAGYPQVLYLQGDVDTTTPLPLAEGFCAALRDRGIAVDLRLFPGQPHGFGWNLDSPGQSRALPQVDAFLARLQQG